MLIGWGAPSSRLYLIEGLITLMLFLIVMVDLGSLAAEYSRVTRFSAAKQHPSASRARLENCAAPAGGNVTRSPNSRLYRFLLWREGDVEQAGGQPLPE